MSTDMSAFNSRLVYRGTLTFQTAHRIGSERALDPTVPNLPLLRSADGQPFIPGSSFKGAWRAFTETLLRTIDTQFACDPLLDKTRCVTNDAIRQLRLQHRDDPTGRDDALRAASCLACRIFGNQVLASKVYIKDLFIVGDFYTVDTRDGVAIDRDLAKVAVGPFQYEAVAPGASFAVDIVVENAEPAELGLIMLGLEAFEHDEIRLGGFKSRGLGACTLAHDWDNSRYIEKGALLEYLFNRQAAAPLSGPGVQSLMDNTWLPALKEEVKGA